MSSHDVATTVGDAGSEVLPADPFTALRFVFGMLLGVEDFETEQAYHRGKSRLHSAWCHREGVLHGLGVSFNARNELQIDPGLALDGAGRELHLDAPVCLNIGQWYQAHKDDPGLEVRDAEAEGAAKQFDGHVVIRFRMCLSRPVPAIAAPCDGADATTAYSRVVEVVEALLRPGLSKPRPLPYHRLRVLFSLEDPGPADAAVTARRDAILAMPPDEQPRGYLAAFRDLAPLDVIDLRPATTADGEAATMFPEPDTTELVLADVAGLTVKPAGDGWLFAGTDSQPDVTVRPTVVATTTIQELLCGPLFTTVPTEGYPPDEDTDAATPGPRFDRETVTLAPRRITLRSVGVLHPGSVRTGAFRVTSFDAETGWNHVDLSRVRLNAAGNVVTVELKEAPTGELVRVLAFGTGATPLLGADLRPLAGAVGGPPGSVHDGRDFVHMLSTRRLPAD